jgi:hypothetical protein
MTKQLIYERSVPVGGENIELKLYRAKRGFLLERTVKQLDCLLLVQVLAIESLNDLELFRDADPHRTYLAAAYVEVIQRSTFDK